VAAAVGAAAGDADGGDTVGLDLVVCLSAAVVAAEAAAAAANGGFDVTPVAVPGGGGGGGGAAATGATGATAAAAAAAAAAADTRALRCTKRVTVAGASHVMVATVWVTRRRREEEKTAPWSLPRPSSAPAGRGRRQEAPGDPGVTVAVRRPREDRGRTDFWRYARLAREVAAWLDDVAPGCVLEAPVMA